MRRALGVVVALVVVAGAPILGAGVPAGAGVATSPAYVVMVTAAGDTYVCQLGTLELSTGQVAALATPPSETACASDLAWGPDGYLYGLRLVLAADSQSAHLVRFDRATGAVVDLGPIGPGTTSAGGYIGFATGGVSFDATGRLYATIGGTEVGTDPSCTGSAWCLYRVDDPTQPQAAAFLGVSLDQVDGYGSTMTATCTTTYAMPITATDAFTQTLATLSTSDGALTPVGPLPGEPDVVAGADFDAAGTLWAILGIGMGPFELVTLDPSGPNQPAPTGIPLVGVPEDGAVVALAVAPLECPSPPAPVELVPTFTG